MCALFITLWERQQLLRYVKQTFEIGNQGLPRLCRLPVELNLLLDEFVDKRLKILNEPLVKVPKLS
eukprot:m.451590 g.451590  ORF g.451590 m.451590 type:complete len:66 (+) comp20175_c0_seq1:1517-1714(+)